MPNPVTVSVPTTEGLLEVEVDLDAVPADVDPRVLEALTASGLLEPQPVVPDQPADAPADATTQE